MNETLNSLCWNDRLDFVKQLDKLEFVQRTNSTLSIMKNGEHWFHTDEQMKFLDEWIIKSSK